MAKVKICKEDLDMALMHVDFFSDVLGMCVNMDVIIPQQTNAKRKYYTFTQ